MSGSFNASGAREMYGTTRYRNGYSITTLRYVHRLPILRFTIGKMMMVAIIWMTPWTDSIPPMVFVDSAKPPVNPKGRCGDESDFGILRSIGSSCSAEMVWL